MKFSPPSTLDTGAGADALSRRSFLHRSALAAAGAVAAPNLLSAEGGAAGATPVTAPASYPRFPKIPSRLLLSGAMHYFRSTPAQWPELMRKSRDAGLNTVETITFWGLHEPTRGHFDFSGRRDLRRWCACAQDAGLSVILRPGPYTCGEINYGGFPAWLRDIPGIQFRTRNQPYYDEVRRWLDRLVEEIRPMLAPQGGPIIAVQIENEYTNIGASYGAEGLAYLEWLRGLFESYDLGVPLTMCNPAFNAKAVREHGGWVRRTLYTINAGTAHEVVAPFRETFPDDPCVWMESWGGWYQVFGGPRNRRSASNATFYAAAFFAAGGKGINYYMWHGGTNFARDSMYLQTPSYDFEAALDEYGRATPKYHMLARLHHVLVKHGAALLTNDLPQETVFAEKLRAWHYPHPRQSVTFLANLGYRDAGAPAGEITWAGKTYVLPPETIILLDAQNRVLWELTVTNASDGPEAQWTTRHPINFVGSLAAAVPAFGDPGATPSPRPVEQLRLTRDETDYCWYVTTLTVPEGAPATQLLRLDGIADTFQVFIDQRPVARSREHLIEDRGSFDNAQFSQTVELALTPGHYQLALLCCAMGLAKGDWMIRANMATERKGLWGRALLDSAELPGPWEIRPFNPAPPLPATLAPLAAGAAGMGWHSYTLPRPTGDGPFVLDLGTLGKGLVWLNGECLARYWLVKVKASTPTASPPEGDGLPSQRYYHVPASLLRAENTLVCFEEHGGDPQAVRLLSP